MDKFYNPLTLQDTINERREMIVPYCEYKGFTIFRSLKYFNVIEMPAIDDAFDNIVDLQEYLDYCLDSCDCEPKDLSDELHF